MKHIQLLLLALVSSCAFAQNNSFTISYNGISPEEDSPHKANKMGSIGIHNPERGFSVRAGLMDIYANGFLDSEGEEASFYEDVNGDWGKGLSPLTDYLYQFEDDGVSLVELEQYVHFSEGALLSKTPLNKSHISDAVEVFEGLKDLGLKAHFIMNSSFKHYTMDPQLSEIGNQSSRFKGLMHFMDEMSGFYEEISPMVAVAHLGWMYSPWDYNSYRHSNKWKNQNYAIWSVYPVGNAPAVPFEGYQEIPNYHGDRRESVQRTDWGAYHGSHSPKNYWSKLNILRMFILDNILDDFPYQKVVLNSTLPWANYVGSSINARKIEEKEIDKTLLGPFAGSDHSCKVHNLKNEDKYLRAGYYDRAFAGDSYSHAWSIPDGEVNEIHWFKNYKKDIVNLGKDYGDNKYNVDAHNLRKYRHNFWMHGEMPVYETEDENINDWTAGGSWSTSSFTQHHSYFQNWYPNLTTGTHNPMFDYEIGEGISSGRLQDGLMSAVKLRYFNFTSFGIMHNNLLDGRSPFEMTDGYDIGLKEVGIPNKENTAITKWKETPISMEDVKKWHLPLSDRYFENVDGDQVERSSYDYIRDHLGYRLELQKSTFVKKNNILNVETDLINRGFSAPQNPRNIYYVLLNEENEVLSYELLSNDWRDWQPDDFAVAHDNKDNLNYYNDYSSLDDVVIGGIPLGSFNSQWHRTPLDIDYNPYTYTLKGSLSVQGLDNGIYKIGIALPDMNEELANQPEKYGVKFANQVPYLECSGISILGSVVIGNDQENADSDGDGIANLEDAMPFNPKNYTDLNGGGPVGNCISWENVPTQSSVSSQVTKSTDISVYPNPTSGLLSVEFPEEYNFVHVRVKNILGYEVYNKRHCESKFVKIDLTEVELGTYIAYFETPDGVKVATFIKE